MKINLQFVILFSCLSLIVNYGLAARQLPAASNQNQQDQMLFKYHGGKLLAGKLSINLIWYGKFKPSQRAIISDFIASLSKPPPSIKTSTEPSVAHWWMLIQKYSSTTSSLKKKPSNRLTVFLGKQTTDEIYSLGKSLTITQIQQLAKTADDGQNQAVNVVLTSADVAVQGFCSSRCGTHGVVPSSSKTKGTTGTPYIWVGNPEKQCPGQCAWPFHQPMYGPQGPPLVSPNNDVGMDGVVINLATLIAGTATNPFKSGYFQGPSDAPLEAASACPGVYGNGAYPGYPGNLLVDSTTGASYNANGVNGKKYMLPALYDPATSKCSTLV